jgi:2-oxoglutarate ferredoxin oxidoreductase subunit gamma
MADHDEIRLCGYGGQGVVLAGHIVGQAAAVFQHKHATYTRDYGPEARGGACRADVIISDAPVTYPYIVSPSVLVAMSQQAFDRYYPRVGPDTLVIIDEDLVKPVADGRPLLSVPSRRIAEELGRVAVANVVMLGFVTAVTDLVSYDAMKESLLATVPKGTEELNLKAFERGYACGQEKRSAPASSSK